MSLLTSILILLVLSRLLGELFQRFKQPAILGEILAGVVLGPGLLNFIEPTKELSGISELSVFLIVLAAGLEMELSDVLKSFRGRGLLMAFLGFILPFLSGLGLGFAFHLDAMRTVFLGLCISITALPVAIRILENFNLLNSDIARFSIATAILNDIAALLLLGVILDMPLRGADRTAWEVTWLALQTGFKLFLFGILVAIASRLIRWGSGQNRFIEKGMEKIIESFGREALFGIAILFVLFFAVMSERLGSHFVIGAFFGALMLSRDVFGSSLFAELENTLNSITGGFLAPIFFAFLGLHFSASALTAPFFILILLLVSIVSKLGAGYLGGRIVGLPPAEALGIGVILNGRGIMELVVANIAFQRGFINQELFSALVLMGVVTTLMTPVFFRKFVCPHLGPKHG